MNEALKAANASRWLNAKLTRNFTGVAKALVAAKPRYQTVEKLTGVPWYFIAVVHEREASQRWDTQLGQGDPLNRVSVHVPRGRGPFATWEEGAVDALKRCPPFAAGNKDWSIGGLLTMLEEYNGMAYASHNRPSPYVWAGTTIYDPPTGPGGKILVDHGPIENVTDKQLGCAGLLMAMAALDRTISLDGKMPPIVILPNTKPIDVPPAKPSVANPASGSIGAFIASIFNAIFKRKS